ncbi:nitroreductase family protein KNAG_0C00570 [Huiozyma naganishii CBS 8797]|uniref:Nitroreductase domain-containing protein n=1 Tax=Huiozyma naganishii (strain ATCC MYA-139 / BCRC 22969 / CBS 8797 / KCTC 17520 / NBRC 10181 / NCYC 3082 / Yp74L-3) TaxID=1071383 RepID=J7S5I5_HUIN7|nr:hypothetical protein KNAG_0C00570 [Kazachstania naganishii CBS 8797]CCK69171.1 hypothetical protein KNAG_0C00570 [Kazachstania naganishii CBS 8797]
MSSQTVANFLKVIATRRTIYKLQPQLPAGVTTKDIQAVVEAIIKDTPTAFNSQVNRAIILTGESHKKVWDAVTNGIDAEAGKLRPASARDEAFGSIIFFTDDKTTEKLQADFPAWAAAFPQFADHSSGAAQITSWDALEVLGLGAHLQHYNPLVRAALPADVPKGWSVHSQLVFGLPAEAAGEKTFIDNKVQIFQ